MLTADVPVEVFAGGEAAGAESTSVGLGVGFGVLAGVGVELGRADGKRENYVLEIAAARE